MNRAVDEVQCTKVILNKTREVIRHDQFIISWAKSSLTINIHFYSPYSDNDQGQTVQTKIIYKWFAFHRQPLFRKTSKHTSREFEQSVNYQTLSLKEVWVLQLKPPSIIISVKIDDCDRPVRPVRTCYKTSSPETLQFLGQTLTNR